MRDSVGLMSVLSLISRPRRGAGLGVAPLAALLALVGCGPAEDSDTDVEDTFVWSDCTDVDGDGRCAEDEDCDDSNPEVYAGRREICNAVDDNCNGLIDEGMPDADQDAVCDAQDTEECDGVDNDGDELVDEDFADADGNGLADCVDAEVCDGRDNNGDGRVDEGFDVDVDGFTQCGDIDGEDVDCNDTKANVYPGASEGADAIDNDCDGLVDEGAWAAGDLIITEIMINPNAVGDPSGEWVEVFNASGRRVYLNGLTLKDANGQSHVVSDEGIIAVDPGDYAVVGLNSRSDQNGRVEVLYQYEGVSLANTADDIQVWVLDQTSSGEREVLLDSVAWDSNFPLAPGASLALEPGFTDTTSNDNPLYWCAAGEAWGLGTDLGSPGEANPLCQSFDHDGDGFSEVTGDCNDSDRTIYPGAPETNPAVDNDCDGRAEQGPLLAAKVDPVSETEVCGLVYLDASGTRDPNGDSIARYDWTLAKKPASSKLTTANIRNADKALASFEPDLNGTYEFSVNAYDSGNAAGTPATLSVSISARTSNTAPTADAGENQVAKGTTTCTSLGSGKFDCSSCKDLEFSLNGSLSRDREGDSLQYLWTLTSGAGALVDRTSQRTKVTVSGATPTAPGGKATSTVFVDLVVTDCMGAKSVADTMAVVYTCEAK